MTVHRPDELRFSQTEIAQILDAAERLAPSFAECGAAWPDFAGLEFRAVADWQCSVLRRVGAAIAQEPPSALRDAKLLDAAGPLIAAADRRRLHHAEAAGPDAFRCRIQPGLLAAWTPTAVVALRTPSALPAPPSLWRSEAVVALRRTAAAFGVDAVLREEEPADTGHAAMRAAHLEALLGGPEATAGVLRHAGFDAAAPHGRTLSLRIVGQAAVLYATHARNQTGPAVASVLAAVALDRTA